MKTTEIGYINRNNQINQGRTEEPGTDHGQWFYKLKCQNCGHIYKANGTDIFQRKCPNCQGVLVGKKDGIHCLNCDYHKELEEK